MNGLIMKFLSHRSIAALSLAVVIGGGTVACHGILDTTNPLLIRNEDVTNPAGAEGRRAALVEQWEVAFGTNARQSAILADEESFDIYSLEYYQSYYDWAVDARDTAGMQSVATLLDGEQALQKLETAFWTSSLAVNALRAYGDPTRKDDYLAESFALRGHLVLLAAETICAGFPLNDVDADNRPIYGTGLTTDSALKYAVAQLDSALAHGKDSTQFINLARVLKGRALLDLGQYAAAATAVQNVPDDFVYSPELVRYLSNAFYPEYTADDYPYLAYPVGDGEGGNGLQYVSEHDTIRAPNKLLGPRYTVTSDTLYVQAIYQDPKTPIPVATGREARLIRIEAAYQANDPSWFDQLNTLRTEAGLDAIPTMPSTDADKVNLIFHERAFWLFRTGHRLGDMRRLISRYGRNSETVFPTGDYPIFGMKYGNATSLHFSTKLQMAYNSKLTQGCTAP